MRKEQIEELQRANAGRDWCCLTTVVDKDVVDNKYLGGFESKTIDDVGKHLFVGHLHQSDNNTKSTSEKNWGKITILLWLKSIENFQNLLLSSLKIFFERFQAVKYI